MNQEFRLRKMVEIRNYLIQEINQTELMSKKRKKVCKVLNCINLLLTIISAITRFVFLFCFCFFSWNFNRNYKLCN